MRTLPLSLLVGLLASAAITVSSHGHAGGAVHVLVLKENGIGSAAQAQPYVDKLLKLAAKHNGWSSGQGKYITRRSRAEKYIKSKDPKFGLISLGAFLALQKGHGLEVIGDVEVTRGGGRSYHLVSKSAAGLAGCKGKKLATNHASDKRFVNKVVAAGAFELGDFTVKETRRPVQTIKKVIRGDATCALIDDAQFAELPHIEGGKALKSVWKSKKLPAMPIVAFSSASAAERAKFKSSLGSICTGDGKGICDKIGIKSLKAASSGAYRAVIAAYGN